MTDRTCSVKSCETRVLARGWCVKHYGRWKKHGDPLWEPPHPRYPPGAACSAEGCETRVFTRGWCQSHYDRWYRYGDPTYEPSPKYSPEDVCSIEGCNTAGKLVRGWCTRHYERWRAHGDPLFTLHRQTCSVEGCGDKHSGNGVCAKHRERLRRTGTLDARPKAPSYKGALCSIDGCPKPAAKRGWCIMHHQRWKTHGDPNVTKMDRTPSPDGLCVICHERPAGEDGQYARYCSGRCVAAAARARQPKPPPEIITCCDCGMQFERPSRLGDPPQRCESCREAHRKTWNAAWYQRMPPEKLERMRAQGLEWAKQNPERGRARQARRRAQALSLPYEDFCDIEIFERDNWICGLCGEPVDRNLRWPDPQSPSLDHILPLTRHGHHVRVNCQLAHLRCNISKGNRITA
jgi:hypothetical protein